MGCFLNTGYGLRVHPFVLGHTRESSCSFRLWIIQVTFSSLAARKRFSRAIRNKKACSRYCYYVHSKNVDCLLFTSSLWFNMGPFQTPTFHAPNLVQISRNTKFARFSHAKFDVWNRPYSTLFSFDSFNYHWTNKVCFSKPHAKSKLLFLVKSFVFDWDRIPPKKTQVAPSRILKNFKGKYQAIP